MTDQPAKFDRPHVIGPFVVALLALLSVVLTLDAAGDYPKLFEGPGVTLDESFNVQMGVYQWRVLRDAPNMILLLPESVNDAFGPKSNYNPDHPPLGRVWLGFWHDLVEWLFPPSDHPANEHGIRFVTDCARVGSATAFALTVFLIGVFTAKWYGRAAGIVASVSLVLMPRVFAHAHLASLETFMNLTYSATILSVAHWWTVAASGGCQPSEKTQTTDQSQKLGGLTSPARLVCCGTGILFGLALLTKMQAILIPPVVGLWAMWHWRVRAFKPLAIFGSVGLAVFFVGWPWLWLDPAKNFYEYFARTTNRAVLNCYYLGQVWADKDVPWHYPFVMFAVTVPIGLNLLGLLGVSAQYTRIASEGERAIVPRLRFGFVCGAREQLVLAATLFPLVLFALPGVAVYDGERLFLISYPMWAVLVGRGAEVILSHLRAKAELGWWPIVASGRARGVVMTLWLLPQAVGVIAMHPCQLSYYNLLVGGLSGADRRGFERTYWGDSLTRSELTEIAEWGGLGATLVVEPVLHQFQLGELTLQSPILRRAQVRALTADEGKTITRKGQTVFRVAFYRKADLPREDWDFARSERESGLSRSGVLLSRLWAESPKPRR